MVAWEALLTCRLQLYFEILHTARGIQARYLAHCAAPYRLQVAPWTFHFDIPAAQKLTNMRKNAKWGMVIQDATHNSRKA